MAETQTSKDKQAQPVPPPAPDPFEGFVTKKPPEIESPYITRFLSPVHEEIEAAAVLLRKLLPKFEEEVLNDMLVERLNTESLNKSSVVYVMVRKSFGRKRMTEAQTYREDRDGARITVHTPPEDLAKEVHILGPIRARDHWTNGEREWNSELNRASFINEVGRLAAPWAVIQPDAPGKKAGELPRYIQLQSC